MVQPLIFGKFAEFKLFENSVWNEVYVYFSNFMRLSFSLIDSDVEVQQTASKYWNLIGDQYLKENEKDYKDEIDLGMESLHHYPLNGLLLPTDFFKRL